MAVLLPSPFFLHPGKSTWNLKNHPIAKRKSFEPNLHYCVPCWVVLSNIFYFHPYLGKIPILTNIFQVGWNHQVACCNHPGKTKITGGKTKNSLLKVLREGFRRHLWDGFWSGGRLLSKLGCDPTALVEAYDSLYPIPSMYGVIS